MPAPDVSTPNPSTWSSILEAIRGTQQDFTQGPIGRAILLLAVPMVLEMVMESIFAVADVFFVSRLGPEAVATVGLTESMLTLIYAVALGLSIGVTALVARRTGEKDPDGAARTAVQAVVLGIVVALPIAIFGFVYARELLVAMGAGPEIVDQFVGYTGIMFLGNGTILLLFLINAIFRGVGDAAIAMRMLWLANGINLVLDPCLIFGLGPFPELGIEGAAIATTTGRGIAVVVQLITLFSGRGRIAVARRHVAVSFGDHHATRAAFGYGHVSSIYRDGKLDWPHPGFWPVSEVRRWRDTRLVSG